MQDLVRLAILVVVAGGAVTLVGMSLAWWMAEERRMRRLVRRSLGGECDAAIVARGHGAAAGFRIQTDQIVVMNRGGANALLYPLTALDGAELVVDDQVAARVSRGEGRRPLDRIEREPDSIIVRMIFNDARNPDFDLPLWLEEDERRRHAADPADLIHEARTWLARIDALLRRGSGRRIAPPAPIAAAAATLEAPAWDEDDENDHA